MELLGLKTKQEKENYMMNIFKILSAEIPQEGLQYEETDDFISLSRYKKAFLREYPLNDAA